MAYTSSEASQELLDSVAQAANGLGFASACLAEAYERLDERSGDRLEVGAALRRGPDPQAIADSRPTKQICKTKT